MFEEFKKKKTPTCLIILANQDENLNINFIELCSYNECKQQINEEKISKVSFAQQLTVSGITACLNIIKQCFTNWVQSGILYVKDFFKDNGQFKTL